MTLAEESGHFELGKGCVRQELELQTYVPVYTECTITITEPVKCVLLYMCALHCFCVCTYMYIHFGRRAFEKKGVCIIYAGHIGGHFTCLEETFISLIC